MVTEELLKLHDDLERLASPRPWSTHVRKRPGYGSAVFWERRPDREVIFDSLADLRYMAFLRNVGPELVKEIRRLRGE